MTEGHLEFTTQIGCGVNCSKYCPQELIVSKYKGDRVLTLEKFKDYLQTVPSSTDLCIAGVSEPFQNQETPDMVLYAHKKGYKIVLATTLVKLRPADALRIADIPYKRVLLHLPDAYGHAKIPMTWEYLETLSIFLKKVKALEFMNMGEGFKTNGSELMVRGTSPVKHRGKVYCFMHESPHYVVMPNGDVHFCCMGRGLRDTVGNLNHNSYPELVALHPSLSKNMQDDQNSSCHICSIAYPYRYHQLEKVKEWLFGDKRIAEVIKQVMK